jgi:hypothetical protein
MPGIAEMLGMAEMAEMLGMAEMAEMPGMPGVRREQPATASEALPVVRRWVERNPGWTRG